MTHFGIAISPDDSGKVRLKPLMTLDDPFQEENAEVLCCLFYFYFFSPQVILTGHLSEGKGSRILCSLDFGKSFTPYDLPFQVLTQISYNPENNSMLAVISTVVSSGITPLLQCDN